MNNTERIAMSRELSRAATLASTDHRPVSVSVPLAPVESMTAARAKLLGIQNYQEVTAMQPVVSLHQRSAAAPRGLTPGQRSLFGIPEPSDTGN